ncbi:MAG: hypothetical protein LUC24_05495, partial [Bacteroidales bacterium]|nr:hypothetical protein [Bacteroidales bacterium]
SRAETAKFDFIFDHYSTENGLPHNYICDIHQGSKGYIWLCTWYGLSRFDGDRFVNYTVRQGETKIPAHNRMLTLDEDVNGYLWLTTYDNRLVRFDPITETFVSIPDRLESFPNYNAVLTAFHNDCNGDVWVGLHGAGLYHIHSDLSYHRIPNAGNDITGIYESAEGDILFSSEKGLFSIKNNEARLLDATPGITEFCEYGSRLYFAADDLLICVNCPAGRTRPKAEKEENADSTADVETRGAEVSADVLKAFDTRKIPVDLDGLGRFTAMTVTGEGDERALCVGFSEGAIGAVDTTSMSLTVRNYDMGRVRYLFPDSQGLLWIATDRTGIYSYNLRSERFRHYVHSRNVTSYYCDTLPMVKEKAGMTWIKMNDYGFGLYDREKDEIIPLNNVKEQPDCRFKNGVSCYEIDSDGILWMSTSDRGLERVTPISPNVDIIVPPSQSDDPSASEIRAICKDSRGNVWVAAKSEELYRYNSDMSSCVRLPDKFGLIYCIKEDNAGNLWLGTKGDGLTRLTFGQNGGYTVRRFRHNPLDPSSIGNDEIYSIEQDADGKLWFGTFGGGISMLESPDAEEFQTVYNNFPNYPLEYADRVRYIHCLPTGQMLVATIGGLIQFDPYTSPRTVKFRFIKDSPEAASIGNNDVIHIFSDSAGKIYLSTFGGGLYRMQMDGNGNPSIKAVNTASGLASNMVYSSVEDRDGNIWLTSTEGISKIDGSTLKVTNFTRYDGIIPTTFSEAACAMLDDGSILFGSLNNIYRIEPDSFTFSPEVARLVISGVNVDYRRVPLTDRIVIPHYYSFFRVEFASLNYMIGSGLNYSYMLRGYDRDWVTSPASHEVTYSHIRPGKYRFIVSVSPEDGTAAEQSVGIDIRVRPSVWRTVTAKILYILLALTLLFLFWRIVSSYSRLQSNIRAEKDVNDAKVRFFTNISHELRTPLTLIIGGIDDISKAT